MCIRDSGWSQLYPTSRHRRFWRLDRELARASAPRKLQKGLILRKPGDGSSLHGLNLSWSSLLSESPCLLYTSWRGRSPMGKRARSLYWGREPVSWYRWKRCRRQSAPRRVRHRSPLSGRCRCLLHTRWLYPLAAHRGCRGQPQVRFRWLSLIHI